MDTSIQKIWNVDTGITDLPENWTDLVSAEVESLYQTWNEAHEELKNTPELEHFNQRLRREWSIETGIIERLYTIDRGVTQQLIEQGFDAALITHGATDQPPGYVLKMIKAQRSALDGLFAYVKHPLKVHYIRALHQTLTEHQDTTEAMDQFGTVGTVRLIKGDWKQQPNNPQRDDGTICAYCPPEQVQSEMERLVALHTAHLAQGVSPQVEAAWLHHRFTQIHPFQDGNGRVARCLATLVFIKAGYFPLVINRDDRVSYLDALEAADNSNLAPLVRLFNQIQKRAFLQALDLSEDVLQVQQPMLSDVLLDGIADRYKTRQDQRYDQVLQVAEHLHNVACQIMHTYASDLREGLRQRDIPFQVQARNSDQQTRFWYQGDIITVAKKLNYFANLSRPRFWTRLKINDRGGMAYTNAEMVVSLHYFGKENRGVMIATAFLNILHVPEDTDNDYATKSNVPEDTDNDYATKNNDFRETHPLVTEGFTFTHSDTTRLERREREFREWLEQALAVGLAEWRKQI